MRRREESRGDSKGTDAKRILSSPSHLSSELLARWKKGAGGGELCHRHGYDTLLIHFDVVVSDVCLGKGTWTSRKKNAERREAFTN